MAFSFRDLRANGIRQTLNENPAITTGVTGGVILLCIIFIIIQLRGCGGSATGPGNIKAYYSTDDGATYFEEEGTKIPPFDKDGKPAYRVRVYRCNGGKPFVNHLERYPDDVRKQMEDLRAKDPKNAVLAYQQFSARLQVKRPGDKQWISFMPDPKAPPTAAQDNQKRFMDVTSPKSADCGPEKLEQVLPE